MSEQQEKMVGELIDEARSAAKDAREAKKTYSLLIRIFAVAIFIAVSSVTALTWQIIDQSKNQEYLRQQSLNKEAFNSFQIIDAAHDKAIVNAITDPIIKNAIDYFNQEKQSVVNMILSSQTEIQPRTIREAKRGTDK